MGQLWERRQERVTYETAVRLQPSGFDRAIEAQVTNLSLSGAFVSSSEFWDVGTELFCDLPLPRDHLRVRGRVAWVRPDRAPTGMGIEFVDLSGSHVEMLTQLLEVGPHEIAQLRIWFEGMAQPIRAEALPSVHGLQLRTALPFLRAGSTVRFAVEGEEQPRDAVLGRTSLYAHPADPVPRLQVELHIKPEAAEPIELVADFDEHEPISVVEPEVCSGTIETDEVVLPPKQGEAQSVEVSATLRGQLLELPEEVYEAPEAAERSHWTFDDEAREAVQRAAELADPLPGMDPAREDPEFWRATGERSRPWLWMGAFALLAVSLASASYTGLFSRVGDAFDAWFGPGGDKVSHEQGLPPSVSHVSIVSARAPAPKSSTVADEATPKLPSVPAKAPALPKPVALQERVVAKKVIAPKEPAPKRGYQLSVVEGTTSLRIPLAGSLKDHRIYPLANPDGLAVKLPHARTRLARGLHRVGRGGLRALWLRRFEGGVQLRVLYQRPSPRCSYTLKGDAIELSCRTEAP